MIPSVDPVAAAVRIWLETKGSGPLVLGLCGSQGSGKSTLANALKTLMDAEGYKVAILSLDDLYLPRAERQRLARDVHPLFATRGVPGTHDAAKGIALLDAIRAGQSVVLPRFDKARDEPSPHGCNTAADLDLLIFEGWCVGATAQDVAALAEAVNTLEREEDGGAVWRSAVNVALSGAYAQMFDRIDRLILLAAPGFEVVRGWRGQQEDDLRAHIAPGEAEGLRVMDATALDRFVQHYERLTRHILNEMPGRADLVIPLAPDRTILQATPSDLDL